jgi:hypothetical protein
VVRSRVMLVAPQIHETCPRAPCEVQIGGDRIQRGKQVPINVVCPCGQLQNSAVCGLSGGKRKVPMGNLETRQDVDVALLIVGQSFAMLPTRMDAQKNSCVPGRRAVCCVVLIYIALFEQSLH